MYPSVMTSNWLTVLATENMYIWNTGGIMTGRQKYKRSEKNLAQGILSTWTMTGLNLDICNEKIVTNCHSDTQNESLIQEFVHTAYQSEQ